MKVEGILYSFLRLIAMQNSLPEAYKLNFNSIVIAWSFLYPFLAKRAAANAAAWDDRLLALTNRLMSSEQFIKILEDVFNGDKPASALQLEAPPELRLEARAFAGNYQFVEGWLRDTISAMQMSQKVNVPVEGEVADAATVNAVRQQQELLAGTGAGLKDPISMHLSFMRQDQRLRGYGQAQAQQSAPFADIPSGVASAGYIGQPENVPQAVAPTGLAQVYAEKQHLAIPDYVGGQYVTPPQQQPLTTSASQRGEPGESGQQQGEQAGPSPADETPAMSWLGQPRTGQQGGQQGTMPEPAKPGESVGSSGYPDAPTHKTEWLAAGTPVAAAQQTSAQLTMDQWNAMSEQERAEYQQRYHAAQQAGQQTAQAVQAQVPTANVRDTAPVTEVSQQKPAQSVGEQTQQAKDSVK